MGRRLVVKESESRSTNGIGPLTDPTRQDGSIDALSRRIEEDLKRAAIGSAELRATSRNVACFPASGAI